MNKINNSFVSCGIEVSSEFFFPMTYNKNSEETMLEQFKPIKNYEGLYEISNFGRVKSFHSKQNRILTNSANRDGYLGIVLYVNKKPKNYAIHHLVWDHFGDRKRNGRILQIDHIIPDKNNNRIDNLQLLNHRQNCSKGYVLNDKKTSNFTGVSFCKQNNKWVVHILINKKIIYLGYFKEEITASNEYQRALREFKNTKKITRNIKKKKGKYKGVYKNSNKWQASIWINGKNKYLGSFINEYDAYLSYQKALKKNRRGLYETTTPE